MGADNWGTCPRCVKTAFDDSAKRRKHADEQYGKMPADEWKALHEAAYSDAPIGTTLREDYEIAITDVGEFYVSYQGSCTKCGFKYKYQHEEKVTHD